jgi:hypothetical protein
MGRYNKYICTEFCEYDYIRVEDMPLHRWLVKIIYLKNNNKLVIIN